VTWGSDATPVRVDARHDAIGVTGGSERVSDDLVRSGPGLAVVIVDDHPVALRGTATVLAEAGVEVIGMSAEPAHLDQLVGQSPLVGGRRAPGGSDGPPRTLVILIDPASADRGAAFAAITMAVRQHPECPVLAFSSDVGPAMVEALLDAGCAGIVPKTASAEALLDAIDQIAAGERHLHPRALAALLHRRQLDETVRSIRALSVRELAVLKEIAEGRSNAAIAASFGISEATIKTHIAHILRKLHAEDRAHAVSRGLRLGLFE
jgi:two-component system, NarL family, response regulator YdfI